MKKSKSVFDRDLPHSLEAEEYFLSCCFIDGRDAMARARVSGLTSDMFFAPANALIYRRLNDLYNADKSLDVATLAEELKLSNQLEQVGGYPYLTQVSSRIPTTAQVHYFIERLVELHAIRRIIHLSMDAAEKAFSYAGGGTSELLRDLEAGILAVKQREDIDAGLRPLTSYGLPPEDDPACLMGRNRYICRGAGVLIVSSAGMGKSTLQSEWAAKAALGMPFHGIECKKPLKSLVIQAEDDDGDIGEVMFSLKTSMNLSEGQLAQINERVVVVRDNITRGDTFIDRLRILVEKVKPDLVWLNPLHAYAGCDISDAKEMGRFLREGLNRINRENKFAYMVIHHTPKPMTGKNVGEKKWHEFMYDASGSAELVNWARAVLTLKPTDTEGEFNLILAKRGKRAGVVQEVKGEYSTYLEVTTKIPLRHSTTKVEVPGRKQPFHLVAWEARDPDTPPDKKGRGKPFAAAYSDGDILSYFPSSGEEPAPYALVARALKEGNGMASATFSRRLTKLLEAKFVRQTDDKRYLRSESGDAEAEKFLKSRE
ncbi:MAG: AAA family ATPase [Opitutaceae bacterium]|nr:AAA family ATPase [Opitutaceae bacterium]